MHCISSRLGVEAHPRESLSDAVCQVGRVDGYLHENIQHFHCRHSNGHQAAVSVVD